jgi:hypothetical protein
MASISAQRRDTRWAPIAAALDLRLWASCHTPCPSPSSVSRASSRRGGEISRELRRSAEQREPRWRDGADFADGRHVERCLRRQAAARRAGDRLAARQRDLSGPASARACRPSARRTAYQEIVHAN